MSAPRPWKGQPYLDELRPPPGRRVDLALFATYSLDLSALGAALLALTGRGNDVGSGSVADFASALESLRGSTRFVVQRGRIARPTRLPTLAGVLDQFVVEAPCDESERSWHPKAALVRYVPDQAPKAKAADATWRLWLGSRNLTRSGDLEAGLLLESVVPGKRGGRPVAGIGSVGALMAARAGVPDLNPEELAKTLDGACWTMPQGIEVASVSVADEGEPFDIGPPSGPIESLTIVSPFLDAGFLKRVAVWGDASTARTLVSTRQAVAAVAGARGRPLSAFRDVLALDAPERPLESADGDPAAGTPVGAAEERDDADPPPPSLHAKLFHFESRGRATLLVGSANATSRAWGGRNTEILAELKGGVELTAGLAHLVGCGMRVDVSELEARPPAEPTPVDALEDARRRLAAAIAPRLARAGHRFTLDLKVAPQLPDGVTIQLGLATCEALILPAGASSISLGDVPLSRQTDLVRFRLACAEAAISWMQRAPVDPPLEPGRDAAALSSLMGFGAFQSWMRQLLSGDQTTDDGPRWDGHDEQSPANRQALVELDRLTLEDIVGAWGADRDRFRRADAHFERYAEALLGQADGLSDADRAALEELRAVWRLARERLPA